MSSPEKFNKTSLLKVFLAALMLSLASPANSEEIPKINIERLKEVENFTEKIKTLLSKEQQEEMKQSGHLSVGSVQIHLNELPAKHKSELIKLLERTINELEAFLNSLDPLQDMEKQIAIKNEVDGYKTFLAYIQKPAAPVTLEPIEFRLSISKVNIMGYENYFLKGDNFSFRNLFSVFLEQIPLNAILEPGFENLRKLK
jgi:hypothetical protein